MIQGNYVNNNQMQGYSQQSVNSFNQGIQMSGQMNSFNGQNNQGYSNNSSNFVSNVKEL